MWGDKEKMRNDGDDELLWGRLERIRGTVESQQKGRRLVGVSKLFRDVPDGRLLRYSRRHIPITTGRQRANPGVWRCKV